MSAATVRRGSDGVPREMADACQELRDALAGIELTADESRYVGWFMGLDQPTVHYLATIIMKARRDAAAGALSTIREPVAVRDFDYTAAWHRMSGYLEGSHEHGEIDRRAERVLSDAFMCAVRGGAGIPRPGLGVTA